MNPRVVYPPAERGLHDVIEVGERADLNGDRSWGARNVSQKPLDRYLRRGDISQGQWQAAMTLYGQWRAAGRQPRLIGNYNQKTDRPFDNPAERRETARRVYRDALNSLPSVFVSVVQKLLTPRRETMTVAVSEEDWMGVGMWRSALVALGHTATARSAPIRRVPRAQRLAAMDPIDRQWHFRDQFQDQRNRGRAESWRVRLRLRIAPAS